MTGWAAGASTAWAAPLEWLQSLSPSLAYVLLGLGAGIENIIPAVPADTFVVLGGFLSARSGLVATWVFVATWVGNVTTALLMYRLGHRYGRGFFENGLGRLLLNGRQLDRMAGFYGRFGTPAIFFTRFLPGLRAVVPVFAGVTHMRFLPVAIPLTLASAIWYGGLVWAGALAGRNVERVMAALRQVNVGLLAVALVVVAAVLWWWWRTRHGDDPDTPGGEGQDHD